MGFEVLQSTWAARTAYERVEGRSVSKVDTFSFHLRHLPAFYASARHSACAGGLQNRKWKSPSESGLVMGDTFVRINNVDEIKAAPGWNRGGFLDNMDWRIANPPERILNLFCNDVFYLRNLNNSVRGGLLAVKR